MDRVFFESVEDLIGWGDGEFGVMDWYGEGRGKGACPALLIQRGRGILERAMRSGL